MDLPRELALPLTGGAEWWYWTGGRPAIDLVNTFRERWWRNVETLVTTADLGLWLARAQLLSEPATATDAQLRGARRLREAINVGIEAAIAGQTTSTRAIAEINRWIGRDSATQRLRTGDDGAPVLLASAPRDAIRQALAVAALDAATLLGTDERERLRICASPTCSGRFYDASPSGTRRWCSMSHCGNAAKARRHRARHAPDGRGGAGTIPGS